jgi:hypothetical protein
MKLKKLALTFLMGLGLSFSTVMGYATISYIMNKVVDTSVTVGNTVQYTDGLIIELVDYEPYTLTYFELEETDTSKHYITYTYSYQILVDNMNIEVSSLSNDIIVSELTSTDTTISITFSLNQAMEYNEGDILNIQFYFEGVDYSIINMNDTSINGLLSLGFTLEEATNILAYNGTFTCLADVYINISISDAITRFQPLVNNGTIVFE